MSTHPTQHPDPDALLEYAYGELEPAVAARTQAHVDGCDACGRALAEIGGVRRVMAPLGDAQVPDAGLESLMAYAEQAAAKASASRPPRERRRWIWGLVPVAFIGLLAMGSQDHIRSLLGTSTAALAGVESAPLTRSVSELPWPEKARAPVEGPQLRAAPRQELLALAETSPQMEDALSAPELPRQARPERRASSRETARIDGASEGGAAAGALLADRSEAGPREMAMRAPAPAAVSGGTAPARESERGLNSEEGALPEGRAAQIRLRDALRAQLAAPGSASSPSEALGRLCRVEDALGEHSAADVTCGRLLRDHPAARDAPFARHRRALRAGD